MDNKINSYEIIFYVLQFLQQVSQIYIPISSTMAKEFYIFKLYKMKTCCLKCEVIKDTKNLNKGMWQHRNIKHNVQTH
jgi:hypothetical protein